MDSKNRLNDTNYTDVLSYCVQIGDCGEEMYMKEFDLEGQTVEEICLGQYMIYVSTPFPLVSQHFFKFPVIPL
jgi:hypothetical protein